MPTTAITKTTLPGYYSTTGVAMTMDSADTVNNNHIVAGQLTLVVVHNTNAGAQTVTITSQADATTSRTGDVSAQSLAADEIRVFILPKNGWEDSSGNILISGSHADVEIGAGDLQ